MVVIKSMRNLIVLVSLFATNASIAQTKEQDLVRKTFENYKSAILNDQGDSALLVIDSKTLKYYAEILELVRKADSNKIESLPTTDKFTVLMIRHRAAKTEIAGMNGEGLFIYAINKGMVGKNSVVNNEVGEVTIDKNFAKGQLLVNKKTAPLYFHFYKENSAWKLNLLSLMPASNVVFKNMIKDSGKTENEFLFEIFEILTGRKISPDIWRPLVDN